MLSEIIDTLYFIAYINIFNDLPDYETITDVAIKNRKKKFDKEVVNPTEITTNKDSYNKRL